MGIVFFMRTVGTIVYGSGYLLDQCIEMYYFLSLKVTCTIWLKYELKRLYEGVRCTCIN